MYILPRPHDQFTVPQRLRILLAWAKAHPRLVRRWAAPEQENLFDHFLQLFICQALAQLLCDALQVAKGNLSLVVFVEEREDLVNLCSGVLVWHPALHHFTELVKVDGLRWVLADVSQHLSNIFFLHFKSESSESSLEFACVDGPGAFCVEKAEGLANLLLLFIIQALSSVQLLPAGLATARGYSTSNARAKASKAAIAPSGKRHGHRGSHELQPA
mmetsp:Transcript_47457/g.78309  ORF Transcript_47457/g.78309 Transcript_47457/m.78309 type:complete len:216 (+) Transcript_47457:29-676(+)